jgi:hypothetical protein
MKFIFFRYLFGPIKLSSEYNAFTRESRRNKPHALELIVYDKDKVPFSVICLGLPFIKTNNANPLGMVYYFFDLRKLQTHISNWTPGMFFLHLLLIFIIILLLLFSMI